MGGRRILGTQLVGHHHLLHHLHHLLHHLHLHLHLLLLGRMSSHVMSCHPLVSGMGMGRVIVWVGSSG